MKQADQATNHVAHGLTSSPDTGAASNPHPIEDRRRQQVTGRLERPY
jgi:hypothetical protein